uniref:heme-binding protein 2-like n=1 Tax=Pristiophorus japonicus TaxID=55135 RepID=UPI00398E460F
MLPLFVVMLHLLSQGVLAQLQRRPYYCSEVQQCYSFVSMCRSSDYETRIYEPSMWIGTFIASNEQSYQAIARLKEYFHKKNEPGIQLERTAPILTTFRNINGLPRETAVYSMVPRRYFTNPPAPRDTAVFLKRFPPMAMFVKSYEGWFFNQRRISEKLYESLLREGEQFQWDRFYTARYNSPLTFLNRHTEVWYLARGTPKCSSRYRRPYLLV